jgi:Flp pilus assembly protein TadB
MQDDEQALAPLLSEARDRSLQEDLHKLAEEARAYAEAEFAFQKSRAAYGVSAAKTIVLLLIAAAVVVFFAVMALVVGLVIALAPLITAWGSTALVTLALLGIAFFLLLRAKSRVGALLAIVGEGKDD